MIYMIKYKPTHLNFQKHIEKFTQFKIIFRAKFLKFVVSENCRSF